MSDADVSKPDFTAGFPIQDLADGTIAGGRIDGEDAILARRGDGGRHVLHLRLSGRDEDEGSHRGPITVCRCAPT